MTVYRVNKGIPIINVDKKQSLQSMDKLENLLKKTHAALWIQHDKEQNKVIKHSLTYYQ